jgi:hypothetical protein
MKKLFFVLCVLLVASGSQAQSDENSNLKGTKQFIVSLPSIAEGSSSAKSCGVKKEDINTAIRFVLQQSKIQFNEQKFDMGKPIVFLSSSLLVLHDVSTRSCAISYTMEINAGVTINNTGQKGLAAIWSRAGLVIGPQTSTSRQAVDAIEDLAKQLVVAWSSANQ